MNEPAGRPVRPAPVPTMDVRLRLADHHDAISVGGQVYPKDADGCVSVPEECVAECLRHGAVPAPPATTKAEQAAENVRARLKSAKKSEAA